MKLFIALALLAIITTLGSALFFMLRGNSADSDQKRSQRMARALALRIALSVVLFACLLLAWKLGYIKPTGLPVGRQ